MPAPDPVRRIGLLGGTFDPPHIGHLVVAELAREELALAEVLLVVAGEPWMKREWSPPFHRVRMAELATADNEAFRVNRSEVERPGPTYTAETLADLTSPDVELIFLLGADAARELPRWHQVEKCLELATFVVVNRPGADVEFSGEVLGQVERLHVPSIDLSSTDIRGRLTSGRSIRYLVPDPVRDYIREHGLYRDGPRPSPASAPSTPDPGGSR